MFATPPAIISRGARFSYANISAAHVSAAACSCSAAPLFCNSRSFQLPPAVKQINLAVQGGKPTPAQVKAALAMQKVMMENAAHDDKLVAEIRQDAAKLDGPP